MILGVVVGGYLHDGELRLILVLFRKFKRGGSDGLGAYSISKKCVQDVAKKPCAKVANTKTETKMDDIKVAKPQCLKTWPSIVVNEAFSLGIRKNFRLIRQCITLIQEINTIFIDWLLTCRGFRKVHPTLGSEFLTAYHEVLQILRMKRHNLK